MASPTRYNLTYDFTGFQSANPNTPLPADKLEIEFINLETTTGQIITNLNLIQRSDGKLQNKIVEFETLSDSTKVLIGSPITPRGNWEPNTGYHVLDLVTVGNTTYIAVVEHASFTSFGVDLQAERWQLWANPGFVDGTSYFEKFSGNGSQTVFTVSQDMGTDENGLMIFINDSGWKPLDPGTQYTINGTSLTFAVAPPNASNNIFVFAPAKILSQAAAYAVSAGTSAQSASDDADAAANSATSAANSATAAAASATSASNSASTATTQATNASNSATSASNSASSASTSASTAGTAATTATNAANSATASAGTASTAATTATNAANSATSSASTASTAATTAVNAAAAAQAAAAMVPIHTFNETTDPGVNDDTSEGYSPGSVWINTVDNTFFVCTDATEGAAVWSSGGGGGGDTLPATMITTGATYTVVDDDFFIGWNSDTLSAKTLTLGVPDVDKTLTVKDAAGDANSFPITVTASGCTIDGGATFVIDGNYQAVSFKWDGTSNWMVL